MGEAGKSDEMKSRKTNLEALEPETARPELQNSMVRHPQKPEVRMGREAQARIGELLRGMYNNYVDQGVPQHLEELVRRLGKQD
jgi:hypothetical protein